MKKLTKIPLFLSLLLIIVSACTDKDEYYERPGWLEPPIYQVLEQKGRFKNYLKCVDRTMYAATLKSSGMYTVFAPNDEAFSAYLTSKNIQSVDQLPDSLVNQIVSYSIVYNQYLYKNLSDVLSGGWDTLTSIKKKTTYYETIHKDTYKGKTVWVYDIPSFTVGDNNYKYIPLYLKSVFERSRSSAQAAADYGIFYSTPYTGNNVQSASLLEKDMLSENGVVHEINQVLEPLPNIEKLLNDPDYSLFQKMIKRTGTTGEPYFITYQYNKQLTEYFQEAFPLLGINEVYLKYYSGLAVNINGERYGTSAKQAEQGGYTLFAPNNAAVTRFLTEKLGDYYPADVDSIPGDVLSYFINAQMIDELVWPGDFKGSMNVYGEFFNGKGNRGDEFDKNKYSKIAPASNGFFYGSTDYIKSRYFETVFTEILLNPSYSLLNRAFVEFFESTMKEELLKCELNGYTQENYTVLLPSDDLLASDGFMWQWISGSNKYGFTHSQSGSALGNFDVNTRIQRLVKSHIFKRLKNNDVDCSITDFTTDPSFATAYSGYSYAVNEYGDMIRYKEGKLQMLGNYDENDWVTATPYKTFMNGQVLKIDKLLQYSRRNNAPTEPEKYKSQDLITYILKMASATQNFYVGRFKDYMVACLKGDESNELAGLSADMTLTIFMPSDAVIAKAITNGHLPPLDLVKTDVAKRAQATSFVLYHIVKGKQFVDDGLPYIMPNREVIREETWPAVLKDVVDNTYLAVRKNAEGELIVSTQVESNGKKLSKVTKTAKVIRGFKRSNYFGARAVFHNIDDYLFYEKVKE